MEAPVSEEHPPPFDTRPTIRLDNTMPEHPKVIGLSDKAFRVFIEAICWCSRQESDGTIPDAALRRIGPPKVVRELVTARLLEPGDGCYLVHDYLRHQRAAHEIRAFRSSRSLSGQQGAHMRWHVPNRRRVKGCDHCEAMADA